MDITTGLTLVLSTSIVSWVTYLCVDRYCQMIEKPYEVSYEEVLEEDDEDHSE